MTNRRHPACMTITSKKGILRELRCDSFVSAAFDPKVVPIGNQPGYRKYTALWDTGATHSVISPAVVAALGLKPTGMKQVFGVSGADVCETFLVNIGLPNKVAFPQVEVTVGQLTGIDVLIGMDLITAGDFSISHKDGRTIFSFRVPSMASIDFVKEYNGQVAAGFGRPKANQKKKRRKR